MKRVELCGQCEAKMAEGYKLTRLPRPSNLKIDCALCGRRRFDAVYEVTPKQSGRNPGRITLNEREAAK